VLQAQLVLALRQAAGLETYVGEAEPAARYTRLADRLSSALIDTFWVEARGLLADNEAHTAFSEHAQCLAMLADVLIGERRERAWAAVLDLTAPLVRGSVYFTHYVFEACLLMRRPDVFLDRLAPWHQCVREGFKTFPERFGKTRSDCHAWSAHPLYHYLTGIIGIRPGGFGFDTVEIIPQPGSLNRAVATLPHVRGPVRVEIRKTDSGQVASVEMPALLEGTLIIARRRIPLRTGLQTIEF
jgi:alpha-L-rhamnosidase